MSLKTTVPDAIAEWLDLQSGDKVEWRRAWSKEGWKIAEVRKKPQNALAEAASESIGIPAEDFDAMVLPPIRKK